MKYRLVFISGRLKGKRFVVGDGRIMLGRHPDNQIDLVDDDRVSRNHACLETRRNRVYIRDLDSLNKVRVNGRPVSECRLEHGDIVELGRTRICFQEMHALEDTTARRTTKTFAVSVVAMVLLLAAEVAYLVGMTYWGEDIAVEGEGLRKERVQGKAEPAGPQEELRRVQAAAATQPAQGPDVVAAGARQPREPAGTEAPASTTEPPPPERATTPPPAQPPAPVRVAGKDQADVETLRMEVDELRSEVRELAMEEASTEPELQLRTPMRPPDSSSPSEPSAPPVDPVVERAKAILQSAQEYAAVNNLLKADDELEKLQILAPDFVPAYIERARLYERRGMLDKAVEQWGEVLKRTVGTPLYREAAAERLRVQRLAFMQKPKRKRPASASDLPRRIRIADVDRERFQTSDEFDEMRLLRVELKPVVSERDVDTEEVRVEVTFYDKNKDTGEVGPTRAVAPDDTLRLDGEWSSRERRSITAAYLVPKGFRIDEEDEYGERRGYHGYVVRVFYDGELQDETARPRSLLEAHRELTSPYVGSLAPVP